MHIVLYYLHLHIKGSDSERTPLIAAPFYGLYLLHLSSKLKLSLHNLVFLCQEVKSNLAGQSSKSLNISKRFCNQI